MSSVEADVVLLEQENSSLNQLLTFTSTFSACILSLTNSFVRFLDSIFKLKINSNYILLPDCELLDCSMNTKMSESIEVVVKKMHTNIGEIQNTVQKANE